MKPLSPPDALNTASMFGPSLPEGLRLCAGRLRLRWRLLLPLSLFFFLAGGVGLFIHANNRPDLPLLEKRFRLLMTWTLPEVHCDEVRLSGLRRKGDQWLATYRFLVSATQGSETSPAIRALLNRRFPECGPLLFERGKACTVEERVLFVPVPVHGLVPESVLRDHPDLLSQM